MSESRAIVIAIGCLFAGAALVLVTLRFAPAPPQSLPDESVVNARAAQSAQMMIGGMLKTLTPDSTGPQVDAAVASEEAVFVFFHAQSCPVCIMLYPEWFKLAVRAGDDVRGIRLHKIDCAGSDAQWAQKFHLTGFPTLILLRNGKNVEYKGARSAVSMLEWLNEQSNEQSSNAEEI